MKVFAAFEIFIYRVNIIGNAASLLHRIFKEAHKNIFYDERQCLPYADIQKYPGVRFLA